MIDQEIVDKLTPFANYWDITVEELVEKINCGHRDYEEGWRHLTIGKVSSIEHFLNACDNKPEFSRCELCGELNLNFDDCGYWFNFFGNSKYDHWGHGTQEAPCYNETWKEGYGWRNSCGCQPIIHHGDR